MRLLCGRLHPAPTAVPLCGLAWRLRLRLRLRLWLLLLRLLLLTEV